MQRLGSNHISHNLRLNHALPIAHSILFSLIFILLFWLTDVEQVVSLCCCIFTLQKYRESNFYPLPKTVEKMNSCLSGAVVGSCCSAAQTSPTCMNCGWFSIFHGASTFGGCWSWKEGFPGGSVVKNPPANAGDGGWSWVGKILWRRKWQPTPVFLSGESHRQRGLAGYCTWGRKESDTTEHVPTLQSLKSYWIVNRTFAKHAWGSLD